MGLHSLLMRGLIGETEPSKAFNLQAAGGHRTAAVTVRMGTINIKGGADLATLS